MSRAAYLWAIDQTMSAGAGCSGLAAKAVLLALAWYADKGGAGAHPGRQLLARHVGCDTSTVVRALRALEAQGIISRARGASRHGAAVWALNMATPTGGSVPPQPAGPAGGSVPPQPTGPTGGSVPPAEGAPTGGSVPPCENSTGGSVQPAGGSVPPQQYEQYLHNETKEVKESEPGKLPEVEAAWVAVKNSGLTATDSDRRKLIEFAQQYGSDQVLKAIAVIAKAAKAAADGGRPYRSIRVTWIPDKIRAADDAKARKRQRGQGQTIDSAWQDAKKPAATGSLTDRLKGKNAR